jgi:hypothetical protein
MIRLGRRATLLVVLSLLISAATAYAECAWVLWQNDPRPVEGRPGYVWDQHSIVEAFTGGIGGGMDSALARGSCENRKKQMMLALPEKSRRGYLCLPDTVDPRGPKGK